MLPSCIFYYRSCRRSGCRCSDGSLAITRDHSNRLLGYRCFDVSLVHSTEHLCGDSVFTIVFGCFLPIKIAMLNRDANSWEEGRVVDTNSLRYLPRRSNKNGDLQFANNDRQTDLRRIIV